MMVLQRYGILEKASYNIRSNVTLTIQNLVDKENTLLLVGLKKLFTFGRLGSMID